MFCPHYILHHAGIIAMGGAKTAQEAEQVKGLDGPSEGKSESNDGAPINPSEGNSDKKGVK